MATSEYRHEYKYLLDSCTVAILKSRVHALLPADTHAGDEGKYLIKSLYLDDDNDSCYFQNEDGVDFRNKYRIRYYDNDTSYISLEKKAKIRGMTKKTGVAISKTICESIMSGADISPASIPALLELTGISEQKVEVLTGLLTEIKIKNLMPKVIVSYERTAFTYPVGNVRITFDENLASSNDIAAFMEPSRCERPIYPAGASLLEVKWDNVLPVFIKEVLNIPELSWSAFSKYYISRKYNSYGGART